MATLIWGILLNYFFVKRIVVVVVVVVCFYLLLYILKINCNICTELLKYVNNVNKADWQVPLWYLPLWLARGEIHPVNYIIMYINLTGLNGRMCWYKIWTVLGQLKLPFKKTHLNESSITALVDQCTCCSVDWQNTCTTSLTTPLDRVTLLLKYRETDSTPASVREPLGLFSAPRPQLCHWHRDRLSCRSTHTPAFEKRGEDNLADTATRVGWNFCLEQRSGE